MMKYLVKLVTNLELNFPNLFHISKYALLHAVRGFVSFENDLLSGGGGSKELLSVKILLCVRKFIVFCF